MYVIVAGCGRVGSQLAQFLSYERHDVVVIDKDAKSFKRLGGTFNGITLEGVAFDEELLLRAGIERADAFAAVTNFDNTNLMAAELASSIYKVPIVVTRLYNSDKELTFRRLGIDYVCGTTLVADRIKARLLSRDLLIHHERLDVGVHVVELNVPAYSEGKRAGDLHDDVKVRLVTLFRSGKEMEWDNQTTLKVGDLLVLAVRQEGWLVVDEFLNPSEACQISRN